MIGGVDHIGIGVSDIDKSLNFYCDFLGFKDIVFDYTGELPAMDLVRGSNVLARVVILANPNFTPISQGMIKLVQLLPPSKPKDIRPEYEWGSICIAEVCMNVKNIEEIYRISTEEMNYEPVLSPAYATCPPNDEECKFAYIRDPEGILIEYIEWKMYKGFGGKPEIEAVNHIGIGVRDMNRSMAFYADVLGFKKEVISYTAKMDSMGMMLPKPTPTMHVKIITNKFRGVWIEAYQSLLPYEPIVAIPRWGDIGHMEFAIQVANIEKEYNRLQKKGIEFLCSPQTVDIPSSGEWKYSYMLDPDGLLLSLVEY